MLVFRFRFLRFPRSLRPDLSCLPSRFRYSAFCLFPFALPRFASHSRSTSASLLLSLSGFSASLPVPFVPFFSASGYSASVSSFPSSSRFRLTVASSVLRSRSRFFGFPRSSRPGFPYLRFRFSYSASCSFPFILPGFAPTAANAGASLRFRFLSSASLPGFSACLPLSFVRFRSLLTTQPPASSFPLFPISPGSGSLGALRFLTSPSPSSSCPACFHAFLPIPVLSFLHFFSPFTVSPHSGYLSSWPPVSSSAIPLCFCFRFRLLGLSVLNFSVRLRPRIYYHSISKMSTPIFCLFQLLSCVLL